MKLFVSCSLLILCTALGGWAQRPVTSAGATRPGTSVTVERPVTGGGAVRPQTAGGINHPTTTVSVMHPQTTVVVNHPTTTVQVNHPQTTVGATHPQTTVAVLRPQTEVVVTRPQTVGMTSARMDGGGEKNAAPPPAPTTQAATSMSGFQQKQAKDFTQEQKAAPLGGGSLALGNDTANEAEKNAMAANRMRSEGREAVENVDPKNNANALAGLDKMLTDRAKVQQKK